MLSDHPIPGRYAVADNALAVGGAVRSRRGMTQVTDTPLTRAIPWGWRVLALTAAGELVVWDGTLHRLGHAVQFLRSGTPFQVVSGGERFDYLVFSDETHLHALTAGASGYVLSSVENTVLDGDGDPYPVEELSLVANWRGRLWLSAGDNRVRHSELEAPWELDPLYTLEAQGARADTLRAMIPHGDTLVLGLEHSLWSVRGYSQYDFVCEPLLDGRGAVGRDALASDGQRLFFCASDGVYQAGIGRALTAPELAETFAKSSPYTSLALTRDGQYLWVCHLGVQYVLDIAGGGWTTVERGRPAVGVMETNMGAARYGDDGLWVESQSLDRDLLADGGARGVSLVIEGWDEVPNARGRAVLDRIFEVLRAPLGGTVLSEVLVDGVLAHSRREVLPHTGPAAADTLSLWDGDLRQRATRALVREIPVGRAGQSFRLRLSSSDPLEVVSYAMNMRGGQ